MRRESVFSIAVMVAMVIAAFIASIQGEWDKGTYFIAFAILLELTHRGERS